MNLATSISCTRLIYKARISTRSIAIFYDTCVFTLTFSVFFAADIWNDLWDLCAPSLIWISCISWRTCTVSPMISSCAQRVRGTITWIDTFLISTCLIVRAFWISQAFYFPTNIVRVSSVAGKTCTFRSMSIHGTFCVNTASFINTRILTFSIDASLRQRTFVIRFTARLFTNCVWITNISYDARADCTVISNFAFSVSTTGCCMTWILTFFADTCKMRWAFRINCTFGSGCYLRKNARLIHNLSNKYLAGSESYNWEQKTYLYL